jgi:hypothetical protein
VSKMTKTCTAGRSLTSNPGQNKKLCVISHFFHRLRILSIKE